MFLRSLVSVIGRSQVAASPAFIAMPSGPTTTWSRFSCAERLATVPASPSTATVSFSFSSPSSSSSSSSSSSFASSWSSSSLASSSSSSSTAASSTVEPEVTEDGPEDMLPHVVVSELDRYIVGQSAAKRSVAIALRNRWRRMRVEESLRNEIIPKNILMVGPTGCGKTEVARRLAKLCDAPFIKVEATKYTEVGYHGKDVDTIIKDLVDIGIKNAKEKAKRRNNEAVKRSVEKKLLELLVGPNCDHAEGFLDSLRDGSLEDQIVEVDVELPRAAGPGGIQIPANLEGAASEGSGVVLGHIDLAQIFQSLPGAGGEKHKKKRIPIHEARKLLTAAEHEELGKKHDFVAEAIKAVEESGIVFIDEIDKICVDRFSTHKNSSASDEGVQRDLLPLIEGCSVSTKYGQIDTSRILFIASGAFHSCKPSDLLAELQGRLPIRVELAPLTEADLYKILTSCEANLIKQSQALLAAEQIDLQFTDAAIRKIVAIAIEVNNHVMNIGARRLHTIIEKITEDVSFNCHLYRGQTVVIDAADVEARIGDLRKKIDLRKFML